MPPSEEAVIEPAAELSELREALRQSVSTLKREGLPFALAGGYALWAYGAPEPVHDVDLAVLEADVERVAETLGSAGFRIERPPEDWLFKAYLGEAMVDVLHRLQGDPVSRELLDRAEERELLGVRIPVLPPTDILIAKLNALSEHYCDFAQLLPVVRPIREQLDWDRIRSATDGHPYAESFLILLERLEILDPA